MLKHYTAFYIITLTAYEITTLQYHFKGNLRMVYKLYTLLPALMVPHIEIYVISVGKQTL